MDNGNNDKDPELGKLKVEGLKWGTYTLTESKAPEGFTLPSDVPTRTFTIDKDNLTALDGVQIKNSRAYSEIKIEKLINNDAKSETSPGVEVKPGSDMNVTYKVTNTGAVKLKDINVTDKIATPEAQDVPADSITCEKTELEPQESTKCSTVIKAPAANAQNHQDTAQSHGTPPSSTKPVESNTDDAFAHTPGVGGFTIAKGLSADLPNPASPWEDKAFTFNYECTDKNGQPLDLRDSSVELKPGEKKNVVESIGNIEAGASCTVTEESAEVDNFDWTPEWDVTGGEITSPVKDNSVTFKIASGEPGQAVAIGVNNNYTAKRGSFDIVKSLSGEAAGAAANKDFKFNYSCVVGEDVVASGDKTITGAGTATVDDVPLVSNCKVTESNATVPNTSV